MVHIAHWQQPYLRFPVSPWRHHLVIRYLARNHLVRANPWTSRLRALRNSGRGQHCLEAQLVKRGWAFHQNDGHRGIVASRLGQDTREPVCDRLLQPTSSYIFYWQHTTQRARSRTCIAVNWNRDEKLGRVEEIALDHRLFVPLSINEERSPPSHTE